MKEMEAFALGYSLELCSRINCVAKVRVPQGPVLIGGTKAPGRTIWASHQAML